MFNFNQPISRAGTHSEKYDLCQQQFGTDDLIPMWVADMDFRPPACVQRAVEDMAAHGIYGYYGDDSDYLASICWWSRASRFPRSAAGGTSVLPIVPRAARRTCQLNSST